MSAVAPPPRVLFLPPQPPEKQAYALARYSRSSDGIEQSLAWVESHSEERFWESFYYDYGHASIADLGHLAVCFEDVSELAAIEILDEQLWDGQARSTRYQDFATKGVVVPPELAGSPLADEFAEVAVGLVRAYSEVHSECVQWLEARHPRPESMKPATYGRNVAARAFDMARALLPLAIPTSVGQVTSIRTLERQMSRLLVSDLAEVRRVAELLTEGCRLPAIGGGPPCAPTLARHARPADWTRLWRARAREIASEIAPSADPPSAAGTTLAGLVPADVELLATLTYEWARVPWSSLVARVAGLNVGARTAAIARILGDRGPHDELPRAARVAGRYVFEIVMDVGGWRDMHRHRRCQQHLQELDLDAGFELPPDAVEAGIAARCEAEHARAAAFARRVAEAHGAQCAAAALPLMHRVRCLFKMDFAEADYVARLRSGVKGHPSYRRVAWDMKQALAAAEPSLAFLLDATSPDVQDPLTR